MAPARAVPLTPKRTTFITSLASSFVRPASARGVERGGAAGENRGKLGTRGGGGAHIGVEGALGVRGATRVPSASSTGPCVFLTSRTDTNPALWSFCERRAMEGEGSDVVSWASIFKACGWRGAEGWARRAHRSDARGEGHRCELKGVLVPSKVISTAHRGRPSRASMGGARGAV